MKKLILIPFLLLTMSVFAQREMTNAEKESMSKNPTFIYQVNWAMNNLTSYWTDPTQETTLIGAIGYSKYTKRRQFCNNIKYSGFQDGNAAYQFMVLSKGMQTVPAGQYSEDATIIYMLAQNHFDALSLLYADLKSATIIP